jgi:hypothetical protein
MKVTESTTECLVLRDVPLGPGLLLLVFSVFPMLWGLALARAGQMTGGLVLGAIGLLLFFGCFGAFVRILTLRFDRGTGLAEITETGIFGRRRETHALQDITGATLQSMVIRRKPGDPSKSRHERRLQPEPRVWRAALLHRNGNALPVTEVYGSEKSASRAAAAINGWFGRS